MREAIHIKKTVTLREKIKTHNTGFTLNLQLKHTEVLTPYPGSLPRDPTSLLDDLGWTHWPAQ